MLFSVIVPVYNVEQYLRECIESIIPQVMACPFGAEVVLIDDGSTDMSWKICDEYARIYPDIVTVFHKSNEGLLLTRRYGYKYAKGEYVINCDSDDILEPNALQSLADVIRQTDTDVVIYNAARLKSNGETSEYYKDIFSKQELTNIKKENVIEKYLVTHSITSMWCKCYRRSCIDNELDYKVYGRLSQAEDFMQSVEIYVRANSLMYYNKVLYYYRVGSGMTARFQQDYYSESKTAFKHVYCYLYNANMNICCWQKWAAQRFYIFTASAIMQSRNEFFRYSDRKKYLKEIREDPLLKEYVPLFGEVSGKIEHKYRLMNELLIHQRYYMIDLLLRIRNLFEC